MKEIKIGIIGTGNMGLQIIKLLANRQIETIAFSRDPIRSESIFSLKILKSGNTNSNLLNFIKFTNNLEDLIQCQIIIECLPEDLFLKRAFYEKFEFNSELIFASSTSTFTLDEICKNLDSQNCINVVHFSNPVSKLRLVEVVLSPNISTEKKNILINFLSNIQREIVFVPDVPGFILNNLMFALLKQSVLISAQNNIEPEIINKIMKVGCNFPLGPFEIISLIGKNTSIKIFESLNLELSEKELQIINSLN